jgi:hypothetical protein
MELTTGSTILEDLGFKNLSTDEFHNLLWLLYYADNSLQSKLTFDEISYISSLIPLQLLEIVGPQYKGPKDRVSLLFAIVSGQTVHYPEYINMEERQIMERYQTIKQYPAYIIWYLAYYTYDIVDLTINSDLQIIPSKAYENMSSYPPYIFVVLNEPEYLEPILSQLTFDNVNDFIDKYYLTVRTMLKVFSLMDIFKSKYNLKVDTSEDDYKMEGNIETDMVFNSNKQIINFYETNTSPYPWPHQRFHKYEHFPISVNRNELYQDVIDETSPNADPLWRVYHKYCKNDDTFSLVQGELHGEVDKDDPEDPTFSYGRYRNYRCFQLSELLGVFTEYDGIFRFQDPDWKTPPPIDNLTNQPLRREFTLDSMLELQDLIMDKIRNIPYAERKSVYAKNLRKLYLLIEKGLGKKGYGLSAIDNLVISYNNFNDTQKRYIILYLSWVFWLGLWMRFWRGPGYHWPITGGYTAKDRCDPNEREQNVFIENTVRDNIVNLFKDDEQVNNFINNLAMVSYNYNIAVATPTSVPLTSRIESLISLGKSCMGFGGNETIDNSYYYLINLLKLPTNNNDEAFHKVINEMIPQIINIEKASIEHLLKETNPNESPEFKLKYELLQERQNLLLKDYVPEKPFPIKNMSSNPHTY